MAIPRLHTTPERSAMMSRIRSTDTKPEMIVRRLLHGLGFRYRLHVRTLPGCPDIVLPKYNKIIQIKGCFWHCHTCQRGRIPKTNTAYWIPKLAKNKKRDKSNERKLRRLGWSVNSLWECRINACDQDQLRKTLLNLVRG
jgi:DNA mismatch endonuclease (patch repair protein)